MVPKLYVALYQPRYGNYQHWALYIENGEEHLVFEVIGQHGTFERNMIVADPKRSRSFRRLVFVAVLDQEDIERVKTATENVSVDNETVEWDCQDYVLEVLDNLEEEFVLDENDEDYIDARKFLREKRGANV